MSTTTIRIDEELKERVAAAAEKAGKTAHAFMLDAIQHGVHQAELDDDFHRVADARWLAPALGRDPPDRQRQTAIASVNLRDGAAPAAIAVSSSLNSLKEERFSTVVRRQSH